MIENQAFIYAFNIILISRLGFVIRDTSLKKKDLRYLMVFQFLGFLLFEINWSTMLLLVLVVVVNPLMYYVENQNRSNLLQLIKFRIGFLLAYILVFSFIFSSKISPKANLYLLEMLSEGIGEYFLIAHWFLYLLAPGVQIRLMGLLLIINEVNLIDTNILPSF